MSAQLDRVNASVDERQPANLLAQLGVQETEPRGDGAPASDTDDQTAEAYARQGASAGDPAAAHPTQEVGPEAGAEEGADVGAEGEPTDQPPPETTQTKPPGKPAGPPIQLEEFQRLQQQRERLDKVQAEAAFLEEFAQWAEEHPDGGVCTIRGRTIGEFDANQLNRAMESVKRRLTGLEIDRRMAEQQFEQANREVMSKVMQTARVIAPGLFVQGHAQQQAAAALVASIPASLRESVQSDPAANLVLALAVRGLEAIRAATPKSQRASPTRSVAATGASGGGMEVDTTKPNKAQMVKRLVEGRGSVSELAALLR